MSGNGWSIYRLILTETRTDGAIAFLMTVCTGAWNALVIYFIASHAEKLADHGLKFSEMVQFAAVLLVMGLILTFTIRRNARTADRAISNLGLRLARNIRAAGLPDLEKVGSDRILTAVSRDMTTICTTIPMAFGALQSGAMIVMCAILVAASSPVVAMAAGTLFAVLLPLWRGSFRAMAGASAHAAETEGTFGRLLEHALNGFRELRVNRLKRDDLYDDHLLPQIELVRQDRSLAGVAFTRHVVLYFLSWFVLVAAAVFIAPAIGPPAGIPTAVLIFSFIAVPIQDLTVYAPSLIASNQAIERFTMLEDELASHGRKNQSVKGGAVAPAGTFGRLALQDIRFSYRDQEGVPVFSVGPLNMEMKTGEVVLISGGNGSGKSTFLKLLTGLYPSAGGRITIDGRVVSGERLSAYFSAVFTDFHLFRQLYGLENLEAERVDRLLEEMDLHHKVFIRGGAFSSTALSSGQQRRLALIASLLEDRPVLVFDEWTADQDPEFRRFFYDELLPVLKAEGKTIIAVSHDKRPVACADRRFIMEDGHLVAE